MVGKFVMSRVAALSIGVVAMSAADPACADKQTRAATVQSVLDCRAFTDTIRRLACFDESVGAMANAELRGDLLTIDRAQRREIRRQAFGFNLPLMSIFDRGERNEEANKVTTTVIAASKNASGHWMVQLDGGALWRQTDDLDLYRTPRRGSVAVVRKGALGSYFMNVDGGSDFRAHRDN